TSHVGLICHVYVPRECELVDQQPQVPPDRQERRIGAVSFKAMTKHFTARSWRAKSLHVSHTKIPKHAGSGAGFPPLGVTFHADLDSAIDGRSGRSHISAGV